LPDFKTLITLPLAFKISNRANRGQIRGAGGQTVYRTKTREFAATFDLPSGYSAILYLE